MAACEDVTQDQADDWDWDDEFDLLYGCYDLGCWLYDDLGIDDCLQYVPAPLADNEVPTDVQDSCGRDEYFVGPTPSEFWNISACDYDYTIYNINSLNITVLETCVTQFVIDTVTSHANMITKFAIDTRTSHDIVIVKREIWIYKRHIYFEV